MHEASDVEALVRRAQAGDGPAFDSLVRLHFTPVYTFLHRTVGNTEDAEDLAQETFVRAHRALASYRVDASFPTWILRIAHHLAIDHHRARGRAHRAQSFSTLEAARAEELAARATPQASPGERAQRGELVRALSAALDRLAPRLRAVLVLRVFEGRAYDEIAAITGVQPATVRTQLVEARRELARVLGPFARDEEDGP